MGNKVKEAVDQLTRSNGTRRCTALRLVVRNILSLACEGKAFVSGNVTTGMRARGKGRCTGPAQILLQLARTLACRGGTAIGKGNTVYVVRAGEAERLD